jgi:osmoprotectant transport system ATP-binding protein
LGKILEFHEVYLQYENQKSPTLSNINFSVDEGEFITILGNSGSGKTTLIKLANRLLDPTKGKILFDGKDVAEADVLELRRNMGYVIQQVGLFPHLNIADNIGIVPKIMGWDSKKIQDRVSELLELAQLPNTDEFKKRHPWQLSGGQQQRVGLARALCSNPKVLLMDEPFGALDVVTRKELQKELMQIQKEFKKTILFVTHDLQEAISLGTRVLVISEGRIQQFDTPKNLILHPKNSYIKDLFRADTPVKKLKFFKVLDFPELLHKEDTPAEVRVDWNDAMDAVLNDVLTGAEKVAVYRDGQYEGNIFCDELKLIGEI